jgi:S1-C subfamily serine protease
MPALRLPGWAGSRVDSRCDCRTSTLGHVTSLTGTRDDTRFLQMSTPVQPGNSGGPRLDMSGSVVGVVVARLNALPNSAPQNVNFAIQPSMVMNFLEVKDVTPKLDTSSTGAQRPPSEVCDIAKKFTIQVYCQGISPKTATGSAGPLALSPSDVADFGTKFDVQAPPGAAVNSTIASMRATVSGDPGEG